MPGLIILPMLSLVSQARLLCVISPPHIHGHKAIGAGKASSTGESAFIYGGFSNWKDATTYITLIGMTEVQLVTKSFEQLVTTLYLKRELII